MSNTNGLFFQFGAQHLIEQYITTGLLKIVGRGLTTGETVQTLPRQEQQLGDIHFQGAQRDITLELKIESYPTSIFIESMQFWVNPRTRLLEYRAGWPYKLQSDYMLHLSDDTTLAFLVPRKKWLEVCVDVQEAYLFASLQLNHGEPFRPTIVPNARYAQNSVMFTGGAAGSAIEMKHAILAYEMRRHDFDEVYFIDCTTLYQKLLKRAQDDPENILNWYASHESAEVRQACWEALKDWVERDRKGNVFRKREDIADMLQTAKNFGGRIVPVEELGSVLSKLAARAAHDDMRSVIERKPRFMMEACTQCAAVNKSLRHLHTLLRQAAQYPLAPAEDEPVSAQRLLFGQEPTKNALRPRTNDECSRMVKSILRSRDHADWNQHRRAYLQRARHDFAAVACAA